MNKNEFISGVYNERFLWRIFCIFIFKRTKVTLAFWTEPFVIEFLKSTEFVTDLIFLRVNSISEGQVFLDFYIRKLLFYDFVPIDSAFYELHMKIDKSLVKLGF